MRDINRYIKGMHTYYWRDIGLELGISFDILCGINNCEYHSDVQWKFYVMISGWIEKKLTLTNVTWRTLEVALTNVNRQNLGLDPVDDAYGMITILT